VADRPSAVLRVRASGAWRLGMTRSFGRGREELIWEKIKMPEANGPSWRVLINSWKSAFGGTPENICAFRALPVLTQSGHKLLSCMSTFIHTSR
jgi:hypothetical protein